MQMQKKRGENKAEVQTEAEAAQTETTQTEAEAQTEVPQTGNFESYNAKDSILNTATARCLRRCKSPYKFSGHRHAKPRTPEDDIT